VESNAVIQETITQPASKRDTTTEQQIL